MATKGKKGGKKKGQTLNLTEFLGGDGGGAYRAPGASNTATVDVASNWADEMEDEPYDASRKQQVVLPTAPRAALGPGIDDERIPHRPPFTAYIANLPYDVDDCEVKEVFERAKLRIENVRLMKDEGGRLKGYGYADFADRDSLVDVLTMDLSVKNRKMRMDLASQAGKDRNDRGGFGDDRRGRGRDDDPNAGRSDASDDWRRGPPPPAREDGRDRDRYSGRDSYERDGYNGRGSNDRDRGDRGGRGFSNYEPARDRDGGRYGGFSRGDSDRGGFSRDTDRGDRGGYGDREAPREREAPKERPRLNLAPRSKEAAAGDGSSNQSSSIFGGAKPVDTLKKEKEMEEKLKKEKEEKEKAIEEAKKNKPSAASIFGGAKPVDTTQREKEIEEKLSKMSASEDKDDQPRAYRPPARRDDGDGRDDRRGGGGSYRSRDDRDYGRRDHRDDRDRRDGDRDRRDGGSERRSYERDGRSEAKEDDPRSSPKSKSPEPPVKKYEEPKPAPVVAQNKFAFLQEEEGVGSDGSEEN